MPDGHPAWFVIDAVADGEYEAPLFVMSAARGLATVSVQGLLP
jgi:hypothetical protein